MEPTLPYREIRLSPLRKIIAARMTEAKQSIPHYRITADIDMEAVFAARKSYNTQHPEAPISINDYVIKAAATALMQCPVINSQWVEGKVHQYHQADISIVIAVDGGLSTPIIRKANTLSLNEISTEVKALAERAKQGTLKMDEIEGGSFSISSLGMYDVDQFDAIINTPQCAILAVGSAKPKLLIKNGEAVQASVMRVSLSLDHRVIDGAVGAEFLSVFKGLLQNRAVESV